MSRKKFDHVCRGAHCQFCEDAIMPKPRNQSEFARINLGDIFVQEKSAKKFVCENHAEEFVRGRRLVTVILREILVDRYQHSAVKQNPAEKEAITDKKK